MFGRLYLTELKKQARPKLLIIFGSIGVFVLLATMALQLVLNNTIISLERQLVDSAGEEGKLFAQASYYENTDISGELQESMKSTVSYSKEECEILLPKLESDIKLAKKEAKEHLYLYYSGFGSLLGSGDTVYAARAEYYLVKYISDNELYDVPFIVYNDGESYSGYMDKLAMEDLLSSMMNIFSILMMVFAVVVGAISITSELKSGTAKLMLLRPMSREQFLGAKFLAGYTMVVGYYTAGFIVASIAAAIARPASTLNVLFVFNSTDVYQGTSSLAMFYTYLFGLVTATAYYTVAFGLGTMTKNAACAIVVPLVADTAGILFNAMAISRFWLTNVINWNNFFGTATTLPGGAHFGIAFAMLTVYMILLGGGGFYVFHKRDVA